MHGDRMGYLTLAALRPSRPWGRDRSHRGRQSHASGDAKTATHELAVP
jgi:hypothetical protein